MVYFDYNATAPVMREAREAWLEATEKIGGNPSSMHQAGARAERAMTDAREKLAAFLGCHPLDLIWKLYRKLIFSATGCIASANLVKPA